MSKSRILILADDLTGAADCGMAFAGSHLNIVVAVADEAREIDAEVLAVDCNTRHLNAEDAAAKTDRLMRKYHRDGDAIVFKKLDSTLRGHVGAELAAVLRVRREAVPQAVALLAPAFPAHGRTTVGGRQLLHGKPLEETELWRREGAGSACYLPAVVHEAGMRSKLVPLAVVRGGIEESRSVLRSLAAEIDVLVCDAETDSDLHILAQAAATSGISAVWAGSAGLAYHLPRATGMTGIPNTVVDEPLVCGPTLFVVGTPAATSQDQARVLATLPEVTAITIAAEQLAVQAATRLQQHQLAEALASGRDVIVSINDNRITTTNGRTPCSYLAELLTPHADILGALVVTGGETARAILQTFGVNALRLVQEVELGVPFSVTEGWHRRLPVITTAGDFGSAETLIHCRDFLRNLDRTSLRRASWEGKEI